MFTFNADVGQSRLDSLQKVESFLIADLSLGTGIHLDRVKQPSIKQM
jgi:hypothetical protein